MGQELPRASELMLGGSGLTPSPSPGPPALVDLWVTATQHAHRDVLPRRRPRAGIAEMDAARRWGVPTAPHLTVDEGSRAER